VRLQDSVAVLRPEWCATGYQPLVRRLTDRWRRQAYRATCLELFLKRRGLCLARLTCGQGHYCLRTHRQACSCRRSTAPGRADASISLASLRDSQREKESEQSQLAVGNIDSAGNDDAQCSTDLLRSTRASPRRIIEQ